MGDVIGKYHPHGDTAVYDTIVRMAQDFSLRYPLIDGQGNFGSVDGDNAGGHALHRDPHGEDRARAARPTSTRKRSTSARTTTAASTSRSVLPAKFPNLLVNGSSGIAVGMATQHPAAQPGRGRSTPAWRSCKHPRPTIERARSRSCPRPTSRRAGIIYGVGGRAGGLPHRARARDHARAHARRGHRTRASAQAIIIDELPYQVNDDAAASIKIGELVREKRIEGISDLRDESDKSGMRAVIELKRGEVAEIVLNNLYKLTQMQETFGMNMVALVDGQPQLLNLQAVPRGVPAPPPRGRHAPHGVRPAQGARPRPRARKASPWRCPTWTR